MTRKKRIRADKKSVLDPFFPRHPRAISSTKEKVPPFGGTIHFSYDIS